MKKFFIILVAILGVGKFANAQSLEQLFEEGNKLYAEANFKAAAAQYQKVVDAGYASGKLYYNLGNAYYKQKMYAKSILYYEKALLLDPSDSNTKQNLEMARYQTRDKIEPIPSFFMKEWFYSIRSYFSANEWAWLSLIFAVLSGIFFILYRFVGTIGVKKANFSISMICILLFTFSVWNADARTKKIKNPDNAIVMSPTATVKSSPDLSGKDLFVLHEGTKITFTETAPVSGWREVRIADGNTGWLETSLFEII